MLCLHPRWIIDDHDIRAGHLMRGFQAEIDSLEDFKCRLRANLLNKFGDSFTDVVVKGFRVWGQNNFSVDELTSKAARRSKIQELLNCDGLHCCTHNLCPPFSLSRVRFVVAKTV